MHDFCVVGGGIVGLATALELVRQRPGASLLLLEKEGRVGMHQTGHNSGVIHAGIYYAPGSLKAKLCVEGLSATKAFCDEHGIAYDTCGKLIVATNEVELRRTEALYERATANGIKLSRVSAGELGDIEPNITGIGALLSPETAIVSYRQICETMADLLREAGADIRLGKAVTRIEEETDRVRIEADGEAWSARKLVCCGGLQADRLARLASAKVDFRIVPFRGEYFVLPSAKSRIVKHLIYPAPDPDLPFLGIHLTRMIDGSVTVGPNAVLGLSREGYPRLSFNLRDTLDLVTFKGFWKLVANNRRHAAAELRNSLWRGGYLEECRKYCPSLTIDDLQPYPAGIRAQAVTSRGEAIHDFLFAGTDRTLHVCNAPSPAATSAIPIGRMIAAKILGERTSMVANTG
ncbi:L-2-hydroxyglutarate oxidase [Mesorhizobium sp. LHD-90]|uniref:L-2-hydroxyglutarate oxidase n=1 Tax=Mesorhizobium sp. LHD-90 TaxID=3071414 RepID=UPI0027DF593A|nr:L-2-hydroxyglutarate oxidase [Mesorhizobium sp. LHD-90]MDQ6435888.1 L-2-hydroxyglutarate oxidase [Mesorhizobium sp. LHD-90]